ncbi:hypothetical protein [Natronococcus sp. A-GB7]|uniref:hypothetical protein n=1 Tax=Natronococcus sp. A-GB7 TaxID=3037649 RepID=UPI00241DCE15|nr:hypothetical protein [Natronococcus sp. A-GB7]MDG5820211.1 hypothetical protein [Natronococcus sp. A-GB7]
MDSRRLGHSSSDVAKPTGLVETWIESKGHKCGQKRIETTFEPRRAQETIDDYASESSSLAAVMAPE